MLEGVRAVLDVPVAILGAPTHGLPVWGICCGLIVLPFISFLKPMLGISGILSLMGTVVAISVLGAACFVIRRFIAYGRRGERLVGSECAKLDSHARFLGINVLDSPHFANDRRVLSAALAGYSSLSFRSSRKDPKRKKESSIPNLVTPPKATPARLVGGLPGKWLVRDEPTLKGENRFSQRQIRSLGPNTFVYTTKDGKRGQFTNLGGKDWMEVTGEGRHFAFTEIRRGNDLVELTDRGRNVSVRISSDRYEFKVGQ